MAGDMIETQGICDLCGKEADARYEVRSQTPSSQLLITLLCSNLWPWAIAEVVDLLGWSSLAGLSRLVLHSRLPQGGGGPIPCRLPQEG